MPDNTQPQISLPPGGLTETITTKSPVDEGTRRWQLSGIDIIEEIRQRLKGYYYDIDSETWLPITKDSQEQPDALTNEWGVGKICNLLSWYLNKNMQLSYYEPEQISSIMIDFSADLSQLIEFYHKEMGMTKPIARSVTLWICDTVWSAVNRARYGGEKQFIEGTEQRRILQMEGQKNNESFFDKIPVLGSRGR